MKKIYKVFQGVDKEGKKFYYAARYDLPHCPVWGSIGSKAKATRSAADCMALSVKEYRSLPSM
jgi:hypothetical protein